MSEQLVETRDIALWIHGEHVRRTVQVRTSLVGFLHDTLRLTGTQVGCEHGAYGAYVLEVDGNMVRGCLMLAVQANGAEVTTIERFSAEEGHGSAGRLLSLQRVAVRLLYARRDCLCASMH